MEKRTSEIVSCNSYTINKANYENEKPFYSIKTVVENHDDTFNPEELARKNKELCDRLLYEDVRKAKGEKNFRTHLIDGVECVSVSNILSMAEKFVCPVCGENCEHGLRGQFVEKIMQGLVETGKAPKLKAPVLKKAPVDKIDYMGWWERFGKRIDPKSKHQVTFSDKKLASMGIADLVGGVDVMDDGNFVPTILDWKCGSFKYPQLAFYAHCAKIEWYVVADLKNQKFIVRHMVDNVQDILNFAFMRGKFKERFGV